MTRLAEDAPQTGEEPTETLGDRGARAVLAYRDGRTEPLGEFVREATPLLWHTVRSQGVPYDLADDVVQGVWVALVRHVETIQEPHAVLKWILVAAKRAAWEATRKHRGEQSRTTALPDDRDDGAPRELPDREPGPEAEVLTSERDRILWAAVAELAPRCQTLLRLVARADRPDYRAIAEAIGMPVGSIGSTRGRCLAKLRTILDHNGDDLWGQV
ncbi:RNA polymerase sigma factor (sigma-70 family) [Sediminihabitans luteus]|uniref:RNA polymerase sigma factor (Sigma-70 family) n=1 Tax=Sediminihabitans luteus TaxID=1138585 RepID=A0A2M9CZE9_9CELL|nr:sigma-70 family RNA polymerase sigma factor [Sediminihabitans luteus]PJJ77280.1 RNA polymerase sigma factor (sigma-70 family) [Sediminihabitans luteus]GII98730.1 RNA polymerase sigma factor [Sediminihabitans luteus]